MKIQPLNDEKMKKDGWEDVYVFGYSKVHIFQHISDKDCKNIIFVKMHIFIIKNLKEKCPSWWVKRKLPIENQSVVFCLG